MWARQDLHSVDWAVFNSFKPKLRRYQYDLQCSYNEPDDKTYYSTMYVRPANTRVSLCIDPLYKASFLDSPESEEGAYCTISEGSDQNVMLQSHCLSRFGQPGYRR